MPPIAIIGTGCRFPGGADSPSRLWELLREPTDDLASKPPLDRWNFHGPNQATNNEGRQTKIRRDSTPEAYFLQEDLRAFDAPFFNISPLEAASMDPQQRLLMEVVYEALEGAGLPLERLQGSSTGVYCGHMNHDYFDLLNAEPDGLPPFALTGTHPSILANRLSYFFDWSGPSLVLDAACSSSLTALHLAASALNQGDCSMAVVTGSALILSPDTSTWATQARLLSPTGRCHMWDEAADGYARGEGVAAVVLKPLADALADGDPIECIIRATSANCDGRTASLSMPSADAHCRLIQATYARAGLDPRHPADRCQYFEAHGTGTIVGDQTEAAGIAAAFFPDREPSPTDELVYVGSVKTVIGHSEATAGLAGLIKASLALQHAVIPPNLHFHKLHAHVAPYASHLSVPTTALPWPDLPVGVPRRASVSSFGFGGSNAHVILESHVVSSLPPGAGLTTPQPVMLPFVFSAASERSLAILLRRYIDWVEEHKGTIDISGLAASLISKRSTLTHRVFLTADSIPALLARLRDHCTQPTPITRRLPSLSVEKRILGVFTGQGAQWPQMGLKMVSQCPQAAAWLQDLQQHLDSLPPEYRPGFTLLDELAAPASSSRLDSAAVSLPLRTALQIIQVNLLRALGVQFAAVVGHSSGEIAAAYAAGWLNAGTAIQIAWLRGMAIERAVCAAQPGSMLAVDISWDQAEAVCSEESYHNRVVIAAYNSPSNVTLSGDSEVISELEWLFESLEYSPKRLAVTKAYHSHHMRPCSETYLKAMTDCQIQASNRLSSGSKWYSSVHEEMVMGQPDAQYWTDNLLQPVRFSQALAKAIGDNDGFNAIIEIGPHPALRGPSLQTLATQPNEMPYISLSQRSTDDIEALTLGIGSLWAYLGATAINVDSFIRQVLPSSQPLHSNPPLPTYPFDHSQTYWTLPRLSIARTCLSRPKHPYLGAPTPETGEGEWRWRHVLQGADTLDWIQGHQIQSQTILPASAWLVMVFEAARLIAEEDNLRPQSIEVRDLAIERALVIPPEDIVETLFTVTEITGEENDKTHLAATFTCQAVLNGRFRRCASGRFKIARGKRDDGEDTAIHQREPAALKSISPDHFYTELHKLGYHYSGLFRSLTDIRRRRDLAVGTVTALDHLYEDDLCIHPATLDVSLHTLLGAIGYPGDGQISGLYLPTYIERASINLTWRCRGQLTVQATLSPDSLLSGGVTIFDSQGRNCIQVEGLQLSQLTEASYKEWPMFAEEVWGPLLPSLPSTTSSSSIVDHLALLYLREVALKLTDEDRQRVERHRVRCMEWMDHIMVTVCSGKHPIFSPDSLESDMTSVLPLARQQVRPEVVQTLEMVKSNLADWLRGDKDVLLDHNPSRDELILRLDPESIHALATVIKQLVFRYPRMRILQVGAGDGVITRQILDQIRENYHSYTFTDISAVLVQKAQEEPVDRFVYKTLNCEQDITEQGFKEHEYDLVIISDIFYRLIESTLANLARLLKPGGRLAVLTIADPDSIAWHLILSGMEQSSLERVHFNGSQTWVDLLEKTGFNNGMETTLNPNPNPNSANLPGMSVFTAQAVDEKLQRMQNPLAAIHDQQQYPDLILVGGSTASTAELLADIRTLLAPFFSRITAVTTVEACNLPPDISLAVVLVTCDMDSPCLHSPTADRLRGLKDIIRVSGRMLWLAMSNDLQADPLLRMSKGFLRSLAFENPHIVFQHLTMEDALTAASPEFVVSALLRLLYVNVEADYHPFSCIESVEPELLLKNGVLRIPRIQSNRSMNSRWLASRGSVQMNSSDTNTISASHLIHLSPHRTYLLAGMTGDLGCSLCQWMITRGARSLVLASRSPKVDAEWLAEMGSLGASVVAMSMDLSDRPSVLQVHARIKSELPPLGGIVQGAMVLRDTAFGDATLEDIQAVLAPKVQGSQILNELHQNTDLDFFLLIGSISGPAGNFHQTAYSAATEFMAGLIHQRRRRGQVGSIIHPSQLCGVGYLAGLDAQHRNTLTDRMGSFVLSERDFLELVAEGILAGKPGSGRSPEIMGGHRMVDLAEFPDAMLYRNPKYWPFFRQSGVVENQQEQHQAVQPIKAQIAAAANLPAATEIIANNFLDRLRRKLRLPPDAVLSWETLLTEVGVDSILAVDLRSWFLTELGVDIAVLQLLGGSIEALVKSAVQKLGLTDALADP
ncbi:hypothetical protein ASPZODRAFT_74088 [Penicilliopsis zonata CBS 506.65]|uniref:Uncharacterized protein n=1 Tax=Penicilliopsis zonata CBS 506.65 TaxID=1073090 RepID=A0A1L9S8K9_9EURO|nr:hypothetical protein ASPZODRAFT_74088 [Penicilliopsis zonata CBS 506.65]OJJ43495.1 hypothetical protein ASPZODRAFT_74088 [Penicilliopsis zonata CBS 506.65]